MTSKAPNRAGRSIEELLEGLTLPKGQILYVHARLRGVHGSDPSLGYRGLYAELIASLADRFAPRAILVPTFTYDFTRSGAFDVRESPSEVGRFGAEAISHAGTLRRTLDPVFSVIVAHGQLPDWDVSTASAFGPRSMFWWLHTQGHIIVNLNLDRLLATYFHFHEARGRVPYRFDKTFTGTRTDQTGGTSQIEYVYNVRDPSQDNLRRGQPIEDLLRIAGVLQEGAHGGQAARWMDSRDLDDFLTDRLEDDPRFLVRDHVVPSPESGTLLPNAPAHTSEDTWRRAFFTGTAMHGWVSDLFPITRSLTGPGVRETLTYIKDKLPDLVVHSVASGTRVMDWTVPDEWTLRDAYIASESGERLVDFRTNNLHVVGYSVPVDETMSRAKLDEHLFSLPDQPDAIPYVTSYYAPRWGFCVTQKQRDSLGEGPFHVRIDSDLKPGVLNYGEVVLPGSTAREVFLSTYICHPQMANNELSGPVLATALLRWLARLPNRTYTYRCIFIPETIGSLTYLSRHLEHLQRHVIAGFNLSCVGDERAWSFLPSRNGDTLADRVARHVLRHTAPGHDAYTWLDRGSDERQYCAPGVDLPVCSMHRSKFGRYPEYHTSLDDLTLVTPLGLAGAYVAHQRAIECLEYNPVATVTVLGEPQMGARGLYPTVSQRDSLSTTNTRTMMDLISYSDGTNSLLDIAEKIGAPAWELQSIVELLVDRELLRIAPEASRGDESATDSAHRLPRPNQNAGAGDKLGPTDA